jgi:hypothetical protein
MISYVLAILLQTTPLSVFGFVQHYDTMEECNNAAKELRKQAPDDKKNSIGCLRLLVEIEGK